MGDVQRSPPWFRQGKDLQAIGTRLLPPTILHYDGLVARGVHVFVIIRVIRLFFVMFPFVVSALCCVVIDECKFQCLLRKRSVCGDPRSVHPNERIAVPPR